jgi:hypothetical protein
MIRRIDALKMLGNGKYSDAVPVVDLIRKAEREAEARAQSIAPAPLDAKLNELAAKWGARVRRAS